MGLQRSLDAPVDLLADLFLTRNLQILSFVETWAACYAGDFTGRPALVVRWTPPS